MRKIPLSYGLLFFLEEIEYTEAGLSADPDAKVLAGPFQDALDEWDPLFKKERLSRREVIRADALVVVRNVQLDLTTTSFGNLVRAVAADMLDRFFSGMAPGRFIRRGLRMQSEKTRDVMLPILAKLAADHPLKPFEPKLKGGSESALTALDNRNKVKGARQLVANEVDEWKEGINDLRTNTYAELLKIATEKKYPKTWVESFFRTVSSSDDSTEESTTPVESPETT